MQRCAGKQIKKYVLKQHNYTIKEYTFDHSQNTNQHVMMLWCML